MKQPPIISASGTKSDLEHFLLEIFSAASISKANNSTEVGLQMCIGSICKCSKKRFPFIYIHIPTVMRIETNNISIV